MRKQVGLNWLRIVFYVLLVLLVFGVMLLEDSFIMKMGFMETIVRKQVGLNCSVARSDTISVGNSCYATAELVNEKIDAGFEIFATV